MPKFYTARDYIRQSMRYILAAGFLPLAAASATIISASYTVTAVIAVTAIASFTLAAAVNVIGTAHRFVWVIAVSACAAALVQMFISACLPWLYLPDAAHICTISSVLSASLSMGIFTSGAHRFRFAKRLTVSSIIAGIIVIAAAVVRETLGQNTAFGAPIGGTDAHSISALAHPGGGLILAGIIMAAMKYFIRPVKQEGDAA